MRKLAFLLILTAVLTCVVAYTSAGSRGPDEQARPNYDVKLPQGFRDWKLISVAHEAGNLNDLRAVLGNDIAIEAYQRLIHPFPDGAIIARLAWQYVPSVENNKAFGHDQSFVAGPPTNVQFMVKDSKKYPSTGGWAFAQFKDGKPDGDAKLETCFPCHEPAKAHDFVFTRYAPTP